MLAVALGRPREIAEAALNAAYPQPEAPSPADIVGHARTVYPPGHNDNPDAKKSRVVVESVRADGQRATVSDTLE
jgi:hypothetical protein